jgi:hypothetical protein
MYLRARDSALAANPGFSPDAIVALTGISRCHRLQYSLSPDTVESAQPQRDEIKGDFAGRVLAESRMPGPSADRSGLKAAQQALELARSTPDPPVELVTLALLELGDWFQVLAKPGQSMPYYVEAAALLDGRSATDPLFAHPLREPRMVFYRPPAGALRRMNAQPGSFVVRKTVFSFLVTEAGLPQDITVVTSDMSESQLMLSRRAISRAIYSPRFSEGKAVATAGVTFTGEWIDAAVEEAPVDGAAATAEQAPTAEPARESPVEPASDPGA